MEFHSRYVAKKPNSQGFVDYTAEEHSVWHDLYQRQVKIIQGRACDEYIKGIEFLKFSKDQIPQLPDVSARLKQASGWSVVDVAALISAEHFFDLLSKRCFPAATFIRTREEIDYVKEPDIFHELFGHCPMLVEPVYADFICEYAKMVLRFPKEDWALLQRLFWFTVEFGLIKPNKQLRAYGGGILSSRTETVYCVESDLPQRRLFNPLDVFRTPYRIDQLQAVYFVIDDYQQLYDFVKSDIRSILDKAHKLGEYPPTFEVDEGNPNIHIHVC